MLTLHSEDMRLAHPELSSQQGTKVGHGVRYTSSAKLDPPYPKFCLGAIPESQSPVKSSSTNMVTATFVSKNEGQIWCPDCLPY
jgi:hypothetical protein